MIYFFIIFSFINEEKNPASPKITFYRIQVIVQYVTLFMLKRSRMQYNYQRLY